MVAIALSTYNDKKLYYCKKDDFNVKFYVYVYEC